MREEEFLGLDVGGTKVAAGVVTRSGEVLSRVQAFTADLRRHGDPLGAIIALGRAARGDGPLRGVGIALPGPADARGLRMLAAPGIPELEGQCLGPPLQAAFGCPASGDNDANACALAESRFGAARGYASMVYFTVSTGIGGGIVIDGRLHRGAGGTSAEFGHQVIAPDGPRCGCGGRGCLEALASGTAIAGRGAEAYERAGHSWPGGEMTAEALGRAARAGDAAAIDVWRDTALYLGIGVANVINVLDPGIVVLGGGVAVGAADLLLEGVRRVVAERCMPRLARNTPVVTASLGADAGVIGAACLAMDAAD